MITIKCLQCGGKKEIYPSRLGRAKFCSTPCRSKYSNTGKKNPMYGKKGKLSPHYGKRAEQSTNWKGGRKIERGYILIFAPTHPDQVRGYVREHRLVMEKKLGRRLKKCEIPHHMNHDKQDNRPENLMLLNSKEHGKMHGRPTGIPMHPNTRRGLLEGKIRKHSLKNRYG